MQFVYFDLDKKEYVTLRSPKFEFSIAPGKDFSNSGISLNAKEDVMLLGDDIRFLKLSLGHLQSADEIKSSGWFVIGVILPPLVFAGAWFYRKRKEKIYGDMPRLLFETAGREATRRLKKARALLDQGNTESYHAEILRALLVYLEHKLRTPKSKFIMEEAVVQLQRPWRTRRSYSIVEIMHGEGGICPICAGIRYHGCAKRIARYRRRCHQRY